VGERRGVYRIFVRKPDGKSSFGKHKLDGRIILRCIFRNWEVSVWPRLIGLRTGTGGGHL
jgi:hypothetical protein